MKKLLFCLLLSSRLFSDDGIADLKLGCKDPGSFHNQNPPSDIKITCFDERFEWVEATADEATIKNRRKVCSNADTNKPNIKAPRVCEPCDWPGSDYQCGGFKEVCKTVEMTYSVTCDEVLLMETINKFCREKVLSETIATQEKIMEVKETGRTKKICGEKNYMQGKPMADDWTPVKNPPISTQPTSQW